MTLSPDDTQPRLPFKVPPQPELLDPEPPSRSGCFLYGFIAAALLGLALLIIALSGFAGWTSGQRTAQTNATATQGAAIADQLNRISGDIASGNTVLLQARLQYLATLTPGVEGLQPILTTATALAILNQPTATITSTPPPAIQPTATPTLAAPAATVSSSGLTLDLPALLQEAQTAVAVADWDTAIETLDVILAADNTYESSTVQVLMLQALTAKALALYRGGDAGDLAEANRLTDRARQFGDVGELAYESYIAGLYLDAVNAIGIDYPRAIQRLLEVYTQVPGYRDVMQLLNSQYIAYGDALVAQFQPCAAVAQYQNSLGLFSDVGISAKRDGAQAACDQQATLIFVGTPLPGTIQPVGVAPVGVPPTPAPGQ
ncbi:MAG: hypothetical protein JNM70_17445 [Anaerolineae bacterium]|nr:hypothetical protein [Anaerolineae bacterium]